MKKNSARSTGGSKMSTRPRANPIPTGRNVSEAVTATVSQSAIRAGSTTAPNASPIVMHDRIEARTLILPSAPGALPDGLDVRSTHCLGHQGARHAEDDPGHNPEEAV